MSTDFYHSDMQLFVDQRVDWTRYVRLKRGPRRWYPGEEVATYRAILQSIGEVCEAIESDSHGHWYDEVRLEGGTVVVPPHIAAGYKRLQDAGLLCLTLSPEFGGYGLPLLLNYCYLEMVARADASLMTIIGLQGGVAQDIEKYGTDELRRRYLPRFLSGELQGAMDLTEPQAGSDLGGIATRVTEENGRFDDRRGKDLHHQRWRGHPRVGAAHGEAVDPARGARARAARRARCDRASRGAAHTRRPPSAPNTRSRRAAR